MMKKHHNQEDGTQQEKVRSRMKIVPFSGLQKIPWKSPYVIAVGSLLFLGGIATTYAFWYADRYLPNSTVAGISVAGKTRAEAEVLLGIKVQSFTNSPLTLTYEDKQWQITPAEIGTTFAIPEALDSLWKEHKSGDWKAQLQKLASAVVKPTNNEIGFITFSDKGKELFETKIQKEIEVPYRETSLSISAKKVSIIDGITGKQFANDDFEQKLYMSFKDGTSGFALDLRPFDPELSSAQAEPARAQVEEILKNSWEVVFGDVGKTAIDPVLLASLITTEVARDAAGTAIGLNVLLQDQVLEKKIAEWAATIDRKPVNGRVGLVNDVVVLVEGGKNGLVINQKATQEIIKKIITAKPIPENRQIVGETETALPLVREDTLAQLGLTQRIGVGTTDFAGSPANRKTNITLGQQNLNGKLVLPGEVYSTVNELGPIEESTGYAIGLVIKNNRTVPEAGGGICQVSTTLFRAVMNAGLPITERANHSYRVSYYERGVGPGLDATIYGPHPDFRWKNDLSKAVLVQSFIKGNTITFELYGTNDGRVSTVGQSNILETIPVGAPIYIQTDTLFVGEQAQVETARDGAKTTVTYTVKRGDKEINRQVFRSTYKAWPAQYLVGTKERNQTTP